MARISIQWVKSAIGYRKDQRRTLTALGLRRLNQTTEHNDSPSIRGMIAKVRHLLAVKEIQDQ